MSEAYNTRPSVLMGISNRLYAYLLDRAVFYFGAAIDYDIDINTRNAKSEMQRQGKTQMVFNRWKIGAVKGQPRFKDPMASRSS